MKPNNAKTEAKSTRTTEFDLNKLKNNDGAEINTVKNNWEVLSHKQKDLVKHQAPNAYQSIVEALKIASDAAGRAHETASKNQEKINEIAENAAKETRNSSNSASDKSEDRNQQDRQHERAINANLRMHDAVQATIKFAVVTVGLVASFVTFAWIKGKE